MSSNNNDDNTGKFSGFKFPVIRMWICVVTILASGLLVGVTALSTGKEVWRGQARVVSASDGSDNETILNMVSVDSKQTFKIQHKHFISTYINDLVIKHKDVAYTCILTDTGGTNCK